MARDTKKKLGLGAVVLFALSSAFLLASVGLAFKILFPGEHNYRQMALDHGQRVEFTIKTSEVEGKLLQLDEVLPKKDEPAAATTTGQETTAPEEKATPEEAHPATPSEPGKASPLEQNGKPVDPTTTTMPPTEGATENPPPPPALEPVEPVEQRLADNRIVPIATDTQLPWQYFAQKPAVIPPDTTRIAVLLTGIGMAERITQAAVALPAAITLSFSPYGALTGDWSKTARAKGHELLLDLPVETHKYPAADPGPDALLLEQPAEEMAKRFTNILTRARSYIGLTIAEEDSLSQQPKILEILNLFRKHGLLLVSAYTQPPAAMFNAPQKTGVPVLHTHIVFDTAGGDETSIKNQLARAEDLSRRYGQVLIMGRATPLNLQLLDAWIPGLAAKNIAIVPVSSLATAPDRLEIKTPTPLPAPATTTQSEETPVTPASTPAKPEETPAAPAASSHSEHPAP